MDAKERLVREFYAARNRRDWNAVRGFLAEDVVWQETDGNTDYTGAHHGRDAICELLAKFVEITGGTFLLEPQDALVTTEHVAVTVRWRASRDGTEVEGNDLAVFRIAGAKIASASFFQDGYDAEALRRVFSFAGTE